MKNVPFIPQWKRDPNHYDFEFHWRDEVHRGFAYQVKVVTYKRKKQKDNKEEVILVKHLGKI